MPLTPEEEKAAADKAAKEAADRAAADKVAKEKEDKDAADKAAKEAKEGKESALATVVQDVARLKEHTGIDKAKERKEQKNDDGPLWVTSLFG